MLTELKTALRPALVFTLLFAALLGIAYPALLTGIGQLVFPDQANGSLVTNGAGRVTGSELIGQGFAKPGYFQGRPSAAGTGYDPLASAGSNFGPASAALVDRIRKDIAARQTSPADPIPADLVTASGSGLDPEISPEGAYYQVARVAAARHASPDAIHALVEAQVSEPLAGFIGEPRVNVFALNRALDQGFPHP